MKEAIFYQEGRKIDHTCAGAIDVGDVVPLGTGMISVACTSGLTGEVIALDTEGVYEINATTANTIAVGDLVYFDVTAREITTTATDNVRAGRAVSDKAGAVAGTVYVKINAA